MVGELFKLSNSPTLQLSNSPKSLFKILRVARVASGFLRFSKATHLASAKLTVRYDRLLFTFAIPTVQLDTATAGQQHLPVHLDRGSAWIKNKKKLN